MFVLSKSKCFKSFFAILKSLHTRRLHLRLCNLLNYKCGVIATVQYIYKAADVGLFVQSDQMFQI